MTRERRRSGMAETAMKPYWETWAKARGPEAVSTLAEVRKALGR